MINPLSVFEGTTPIFLMLLVGFLAGRLGVLKMSSVKAIMDLVFKVTLPLLLFVILVKVERGLFTSLGLLTIYGFGFSMIIGLAAYLISILFGFDAKVKASMVNIALIPNTTFIGYPIALSLFGNEGLTKAMFYDLGLVLVMVPAIMVSAVAAAQRVNRQLIANILLTPILGAVAIGVLWSITGIQLPSTLEKMLVSVGNITLPLVLLSLGAYIYNNLEHVRMVKGIALPAALILRLVLAPFLVFFLCTALRITGQDRDIMILLNSMPPGISTSILAMTYDLDPNYALAAILSGTVISSITIPIILVIML